MSNSKDLNIKLNIYKPAAFISMLLQPILKLSFIMYNPSVYKSISCPLKIYLAPCCCF